MKVFAVSGSPRKGNTEWILQKLLDNLERQGAEVELFSCESKMLSAAWVA